jgi:hypothetical protein
MAIIDGNLYIINGNLILGTFFWIILTKVTDLRIQLL